MLALRSLSRNIRVTPVGERTIATFRDDRGRISRRRAKGLKGPSFGIEALQRRRRSGCERHAEAIERDAQSFAARLDVGLLTSPTQKERFDLLVGREGPQFVDFCGREESG